MMENDDPRLTPVAASEPKFWGSLISRRTLPRIVLAYLMICAAVWRIHRISDYARRTGGI